jgi:serine/threonine protein kinase
MDQQPTWIGRTLSGRYRIDALLGQRGMSAVASLRHPNIVQVYDFNNDKGVYYMVLEFIPESGNCMNLP